MLHLEEKLFELRGCLLLVRRDYIGSSEFTIYEMRKGCCLWSIKYLVDTDDFMKLDPPGAEAYYHSYPNPNPNPNPNPYAAADVGVQNWEVENLVHHYGGDTAGSYNGAGETVPQDGSQHLVPAIPTHSNWPNQKSTVQPRGPWKKIPKKTKIAQSAWCEICKIECNTKDVLDQHKLGPSENPKKGTSGSKKKAETPQELEMKRRKVLEGGAAASAVRTCSFCNVVCNSDTVFRYHLAGQKHASMLKKSQQAAVAGTF
nr:zinc finger RNA-binding protein [Tanacetum cinerariifolium]